MKTRFENLASPQVVAIASLQKDDHTLRAIAREWPGGAPEVFLEYIAFGDEAAPYVIERQVKVEPLNATTVDALTWEDDRVVITTDSHTKQRLYVVRASSEKFETKAVRRE